MVCLQKKSDLAAVPQEAQRRTAYFWRLRQRIVLIDKRRLDRPNLAANTTKSAGKTPRCGQTPAYPQHPMCRNRVLLTRPVFVQLRCKPDTMFFQPVRAYVNP
jgi:hypothetical protein